MKKLLFLFVFLPVAVLAQDKGVHFEHQLSWTAIKAKAKAENKYIFMDCFTTWCGPCRYMSSTIFPTEEAGQAMNEKFISVKVQIDSTENDDAQVKSWYRDAHDIATSFQIKAYPTYLVFDADGNAIHRFVGSTQTAAAFVEEVKDALNPDKQYYVLLNQYRQGRNDSAFLHRMADAAESAYDLQYARKIADEYIATQSDLFNKPTLSFIAEFTQHSQDKGFPILLNNTQKVDSILGEGTAERIITEIIISEEIFDKYKNTSPDWDRVSTTVHEKYPAFADEAIATGKVSYYHQRNDWNNFQYAVVDYMKHYGEKATPPQLNAFAWAVFQNCEDMTCVTEALEWSRRSFKDNMEPGYLDTYANILYKLGKKDEAITWEQKARDLAPESDKKDYEATIDKMRKGVKTWN